MLGTWPVFVYSVPADWHGRHQKTELSIAIAPREKKILLIKSAAEKDPRTLSNYGRLDRRMRLQAQIDQR